MSLSQDDYDALKAFLASAIGLVLGDNRQYLVATRLQSLLTEFGFASVTELVEGLRTNRPSSLRERVIDAMTTKETSWFRDRYPFTALAGEMLPTLTGKPRVRIWSAACATGQEAYSIAMLLHDRPSSELGFMAKRVEILASDIAASVIDYARRGCYSKSSLDRGLPLRYIDRYFLSTGDCWQVKPILRNAVQFRVHNLLQSFALLGRFEIIFCRNALIYFALPTRCDIVRRFCQILNPGGYLVLGGSESLSGCDTELIMQRTAGGVYYRKPLR